MKPFRTTAILAPALTCALLGGLAAPANARIIERFPLDFEDSGTTEPGFCGVEDLVVDFTYRQTGEGRLHERGRDGTVFFHGAWTFVETFTHEGRTVTHYGRILEKDQKVTDNGDGTFDALVKLVGPSRLVNQDGKVIAKNDGQVRLLLTIDAESGDVIDQTLVFGSTGTNDDFCAATIADWGL